VIDTHDLAVVFALRAEGATFAGALDNDKTNLTSSIIAKMEEHNDEYHQLLLGVADKVIEDNKNIWEEMPYFMLYDVSKWILPDIDGIEFNTAISHATFIPRLVAQKSNNDFIEDDVLKFGVPTFLNDVRYEARAVRYRVKEALSYTNSDFLDENDRWVVKGLATQLGKFETGKLWIKRLQDKGYILNKEDKE